MAYYMSWFIEPVSSLPSDLLFERFMSELEFEELRSWRRFVRAYCRFCEACDVYFWPPAPSFFVDEEEPAVTPSFLFLNGAGLDAELKVTS